MMYVASIIGGKLIMVACLNLPSNQQRQDLKVIDCNANSDLSFSTEKFTEEEEIAAKNLIGKKMLEILELIKEEKLEQADELFLNLLLFCIGHKPVLL